MLSGRDVCLQAWLTACHLHPETQPDGLKDKFQTVLCGKSKRSDVNKFCNILHQ